MRWRMRVVEKIFLEQHLLVAKEIECAIRGRRQEVNAGARIS